MTLEQLAFFGITGALVYAIVLMWVPYRSGRAPLALYDQGAAISVLGTLSALSYGAHGSFLWAGGVGAIMGIAAYVLVSLLTRGRFSLRSKPFLCLFYSGSFALFAACTFLGAAGARRFLAQ